MKSDGFTYQEPLMQTENDKLRYIADHYGLFHQLGNLVEELNELAMEAADSVVRGSITDNLISEIADVEVMLSQIKYLGQIEQADIDAVKAYKINRQIMRIQREDSNVQMS